MKFMPFLVRAASLATTLVLATAALASPMTAVSTNSRANVTGAGPSMLPVFSGDGQAVTFVSAARNLIGGYPASPHLDVMIRYPSSHATHTVSLRYPSGGGGNGDSVAPSISSNGQWVVFASSAVNLLPPFAGYTDTNDASDVFVRNMEMGQTYPVSVNAYGTGLGNGPSGAPLISTDGRWVVFESSASDLVTGDTNNARDIFRLDMSSGGMVRVSVGLDTSNLTVEGFELGGMTPDAQRVAFRSVTTRLVPVDTNTTTRINGEAYLRDLTGGVTWWASRDVAPYFTGSTNGYATRNLSVSGDGRFLAFLACNGASSKGGRLWSDGGLYAFDTTNALLFLFDSASDQLTLVASNAYAGCFPQISANGRYVAYADSTNVWRWDRLLATNEVVSVTREGFALTNGASRGPVMSRDGQQVLFYSTAGGLATNAVNGLFQLYHRDITAASTRLLSVNTVGAAANRDSFPGTAAFSPDGTSVAFDSPAEDLVADDANQASDVFLYHLSGDTTELVSIRTSNRPEATSVADCVVNTGGVSTNGRVVVVGSTDGQLALNDTNGRRDWFVVDTASGIPSSLTLGLPGGPSGYPSLSADGRFVAFATTNTYSTSEMRLSLHRYDVLTGTCDWVTNTPIPLPPYSGPILFAMNIWGMRNTNLVVISPDGSKIAFGMRSLSGARELRIHDFNLGTNWAASSTFNSAFDFVPLAFSPDGRWLASAAISSGPDAFRIDLHDLTVPQSPAQSLVTNQNRYLPIALSISADSRYLAYPVGNTGWSIYRHRLDAAEPNLFVCTNCSEPSISSGGRLVAYVRRSDQATRRDDILVKDLQTGVEQLITASRFGTSAANGTSSNPRMTPDGRYVVFASAASDLVANDTNKVFDLFLRDRLLGTTTCLSVNQQGVPANGSSANPILTGDGRMVVFQSVASDVVFADYNDKRDVFAVRIGRDDTDGDDLDDDWEMAFFENLSHDGTADSDSDGSSDRAEFLAGTDPTNQGSVLRATTLVPQGGGNTAILWQAVPGRTYQVQFKNSLSDVNWSALPGTVTATTTTGVMTDATASGTPQRFYRVTMAP